MIDKSEFEEVVKMKDGKHPNPNTIHPIAGYDKEIYVKPTITNPNIIVGDFTYIADSDFESHVSHLYEWNDDKLIIGKFCQIAAGVEFVMNGANHQMNAVSTFPFYTLEGWEMSPPAKTDLPLKGDIDRLVITAKDYDDFLRLMHEAGYEIKTGKYISFRAEGQERFTRSKTIGENYTEERIKERIAGRTPRRSQRQATPKGISLIGDIQERIRFIDSKGYEYKAKLTILKEAARTLNYLTENNLLQYDDLEKKVEDVHSSYERTGKELKGVEARLREVQPLIKNISNYQRLKPVYDAFQKAKDKPSFKTKHEAELVIFEAARSTLLAMQGDEKLPSLKTLQAEQAQLFEEQERLYAERNRLKKEAKQIETIKSNVDTFLSPSAGHDRDHLRSTQRE